ncbi:MAG TPA: EAL domain-containing protein [Candidimonas sp.]|nr:EAL domain-containing protein [Candidimonas sp.]
METTPPINSPTGPRLSEWRPLSKRFWILSSVVAVLAIGMAAVLATPFPNQALPATYLAVHTAMEIFAVIVAAMIFSVGWHSFNGDMPRSIVILSSAFLGVALLDLGHLLSVSGMPDFITPSSVQKGIEFWLAARFLAAAALVTVALLPRFRSETLRRPSTSIAAVLTITAIVYWLVLFQPGTLPATFVEGQGLTQFKVAVEYLLTVMYLLAALLLLPRAVRTRRRKTSYLTASAAIMAMSEVFFSVYTHGNDVYHALGHVYKMLAYGFLYWAIFVDAMEEPYKRLKRSEQSLAQSEHKFRSLLEVAPDAMLLIDPAGNVSMMNAMAEEVFRGNRDAVVGLAAETLIPRWEGDQQLPEIMCQRMQGGWFPAEVNWGELKTDAGVTSIAVVRDISERNRLQQLLVDQLTHDALTGLPNRQLIVGKLEEALAHARFSQSMVAVLFVDIDFFKKINDTFGHTSGDEVLRECVNRLSNVLPSGDTLARQGGDEFLVLQKDIKSGHEAAVLADKLLSCLRDPFHIQGQEVFLGASIGITLFPDDDTDEEGLLHRAHVAMSSVKKDMRNAYRFYTSDMDENLRDRLEMESYLHHSIKNNELLLHYQPKVTFSTGVMVGVEALVRWHHPVLGLVPPGRFIPLAEECGLIGSIGMWVLKEACNQAQEWRRQGLPPIRVSVNLSARQFQEATLATQVAQVLAQTGLDPACLELEITEGTVMQDTKAAIAALQALKRLGVALSIDDFGTGYSSLSYLKQFPIDVLKIDRSFVQNVTHDQNDAAITRAIVALAHGLDLAVIAEGVETLEQANFLKLNGCDEMQGFYFSRPVPADQLASILRAKPVSHYVAAH